MALTLPGPLSDTILHYNRERLKKEEKKIREEKA
jgi:hypothetical protein